MARAAACYSPPAWLLLIAAAAALLLLFPSAATAQEQDCLSSTFSNGRTFARCTTLPVLGASLHWTYHPTNGTADVAFRAASGSDGWVAWGINTERPGAMPGSSVLVASQDGGSGVVSVLMTYLESTAPTLTNGTLKYAVPVGPAAEYSGGAYTIFATVELPGNSTQQNTVWQAGPVSNGQISPHPRSGANLQSTKRLDFLTGSSSSSSPAAPAPAASNSWLHHPNIHGVLGILMITLGAIIAR